MRIALLQMCSGIDPAENTATIVQAAKDAAAGGAAMLFTPEMSGLVDRDRARANHAIVVEDENIVLSGVRTAARSAGIIVALGSLALRGGHDKWVNRSFVIGADGAIVARYDKIHLFDVDLPSGESWRESSVYQGGTVPIAAKMDALTIGLTVCYDLRFPELFRALAKAGAQLIAVPSAFTRPTGAAHWETLLRARAIETGAFIVAAAQSGVHADGRETWGHSLVVDPWGSVLLDMGSATGLAFCDIDLAMVADVRQRIPALANARPIGDVQVMS
ncbi:MAG: carbon-nitrogen hydrolase family protein [Parasphingorhabdus sp.]|nr:carbon-nitrogen hydrolase family protein [Parasphingorhabdus sp.]